MPFVLLPFASQHWRIIASNLAEPTRPPPVGASTASADATATMILEMFGSDTLVLVTPDRNLLFAILGPDDRLVVSKNITLCDVVGFQLFERHYEFSADGVFTNVISNFENHSEAASFDSESSCSDFDIAARLKAFGKDIDIDSHGLAVAISSYQDLIKVVFLLPCQYDQLRSVKSTYEIVVDGLILHAKFLHLSSHITNKVALAVYYITESSQHRLSIYQLRSYDIRPAGSGAQPMNMIYSIPLPQSFLAEMPHSTPLLMIPMHFRTSVLLVSQLHLTWIPTEDLRAASSTTRYDLSRLGPDGPLPIAYFSPPMMSSSRLATMSFFATSAVAEYVYLAFDTGAVYIVAVSTDNDIAMQPYTHVYGDIGTGFTVFEGDDALPDLVIVGGEMKSGGVYEVQWSTHQENLDMNLLVHFENWAPIHDFQVLHTTNALRDRLFISSGCIGNGAISQFRYGVKASVLSHGSEMFGVTGIFPLINPADADVFLFLISTPWNSCLVSLDSSLTTMTEINSHTFFDLGSETVFARSLPFSPYAVQITDSKLIIADIETRRVVKALDLPVNDDQSDAKYLRVLADMDDSGSIIVLNIFLNKKYTTFVYVISVGSTGLELSQLSEFICDVAPVSVIKVTDIGDIKVCIIGFYDQPVRLCRIDPVLGFCDMASLTTIPDTYDVGSVPESIFSYNFPSRSSLSTTEMRLVSSQAQVLIGYRSGSLLILSLKCSFDPIANSCTFDVARDRRIRLGKMPVQLRTSCRPDVVFLCSDSLWMFTSSSINEKKFSIEPVIFEDLQDAPVTILQPLPLKSHNNAIVGLHSGQFIIASIGC
ncbi:mono-functional DNA-alkylating methyl methanesulfonate N-term-domain-containing protein [Limtongia smithiae]|uniref:mono-functional DNA-alkylating methyl methanesulfonate N-term-domain-containing protein n=1 Tax=Limtongia smithiae TaxID=1125753 RepID=UPI0034CEED08